MDTATVCSSRQFLGVEMAYKERDEPVPDYRLVKFLGRGNFGEVWKAVAPGGGDVALKIINLVRREGFKEVKAVRLCKSIRHPNLTPVMAFWFKDDNGYLLDEDKVDSYTSTPAPPAAGPLCGTLMIGKSEATKPRELIIAMGLGDMSLSDRLEQCVGGIPPNELFDYLEPAARAVDFLNSPTHDLGRGPISPIQHCDIKPQNILIVGGAAQVCDFGLAREIGVDTKMTSAAATPAYGAPELLEGSPPSPSTDQYSLAITYVELRTGRLPFLEPDSFTHVIKAHLQSQLDLSDLSDAERVIIRKATSRNPSDRYETSLKMIKALKRVCPRDDDSQDSTIRPAKRKESATETKDRAKTTDRLQETLPCDVANSPESALKTEDAARMPSATTETPSGVGLDQTKVGPTKRTPKIPPARPEPPNPLVRFLKPAVAALAAVGIAAGIWWFSSKSPGFKDYGRAVELLKTASSETDPLEKAKLASEVIEVCKPYKNIADFAEQDDGAQGLLDQVRDAARKKARDDWSKIDPLPSDDALVEPLKALIDHCDRFATVFPNDQTLQTYRGKAATRRQDIEHDQQEQREAGILKIVDECEQALDNKESLSQADLAKVRELKNAAKDLNLLKPDIDIGFRTRLALARSQARDGQWPSDEELTSLRTAFDELSEKERAKSTTRNQKKRQMQLLLLQAGAKQRKTPTDPIPALRVLDEFTSADAPRTLLGGWELDQFEGLVRWANSSVAPDNRIAEFQRIVEKFRTPELIGELRNKASSQWDDRDLPALDKTLALLEEAAGQEPFVRELRYLSQLADQNASPQVVKRALKEAKELLEGDECTRLLDLAICLKENSVATQRENLPATVQLVRTVRDNLDGRPKEQEQVAEFLRELDAKQIELWIADPSGDAGDEYFKNLKAACNAAIGDKVRSGLVNAAKAECLLQGQKEKPTREDLREVDGLLRPAEALQTGTEHQRYENYVRLLDREKREEPLSDVDKRNLDYLVAAAQKSPPDLGFALDPRRAALADVFIQSADRLRAAATPPSKIDAVRHPYGLDNEGQKTAKQAYNWLDGARKLPVASEKASETTGGRLDDSSRFKLQNNLVLALANLHPPTDEAKELPTMVQALMGNEESNPIQLPLWYLHSKLHADEPKGIKSRADLVEKLLETTKSEPETFALDQLIDETIQDKHNRDLPAGNDERSKQLARLFYYKGKIREKNSLVWSAQERDKIPKAYALAIKYDKDNSEYVSRLGFAQLNQVTSTLDDPSQVERNDKLIRAVLQTAKAAIDSGKEYHGIYGVLAEAALLDSRRHLGPDRTKRAEEAVQAGERALKALKLSRADDDCRSLYVITLGDSCVALANCIAGNDNKRATTLLENAVSTIKQLQGGFQGYADYAYTVQGNAHEDLAWLVKKDPDKNYKDAIDDFTAAIEDDKNRALPHLNLGRCYVKIAQNRQRIIAGKDELDEAFQELNFAIKKDSQLAKTHRWLGEAYICKREFAKAAEQFQREIELARKCKSPDLPLYAVRWTQARFDSEALPPAGSKSPPQTKLREEIEELLKEIPPNLENKEHRNTLKAYIGKCFAAEGDSKQALAQWAVDVPKAEKSDVELLRARVKFAMDYPADVSAENAMLAAKRIAALMGSETEPRDFYSLAYFCSAQGLTNGLPDANRDKLVKDAIDSFGEMIRTAGNPKNLPSTMDNDLVKQWIKTLKDVINAYKGSRHVDNAKQFKSAASGWFKDLSQNGPKRINWTREWTDFDRQTKID